MPGDQLSNMYDDEMYGQEINPEAQDVDDWTPQQDDQQHTGHNLSSGNFKTAGLAFGSRGTGPKGTGEYPPHHAFNYDGTLHYGLQQQELPQHDLEGIAQNPMQNELSMAEKQELMKMNQQMYIPTQLHQQMHNQQEMMANC